jgi:hypothetical protein
MSDDDRLRPPNTPASQHISDDPGMPQAADPPDAADSGGGTFEKEAERHPRSKDEQPPR